MVLLTNKVLQGIVNPHPVREEKTTPGRKFMEEKQVLFSADFSMVPFCGFGEESFVFCQLFLVGETDAVNPL
jgi:hypothetical protein